MSDFRLFKACSILMLILLQCTQVQAADTLPGQEPMPDGVGLEFWAEVDEVLPSITLRFLFADDFAIHRRVYSEFSNHPWTQMVASTGPGTESWADTSVVIGQVYEYRVKPHGSAPFVETPNGYVTAGIRVDKSKHRGTIILVMAENIIADNTSRIEQLYRDLIGDGWKVETVYTPYFNRSAFRAKADSATHTYGFWGHRYPEVIRDRIRSIYDADPGKVKLVYFLGHTPINLSGTYVVDSDGHGPRKIFATDHYYVDVDGIWTDEDHNNTALGLSTFAYGVPNVAGDGMWDQNYLPSEVEMGFGRVDPWDRRAEDWFDTPLTESERLARYLDKAHAYRHLLPFGFPGSEMQAGRKAMMRGPAGQTGPTATSAQLLGFVGPSRMDDYVRTQHLPSAVAPVSNGDIQITVDQGPYLFWGQSSQGPTVDDKYRKSVFNHGYQSWWGDWHIVSDMRKATMDENMVLSWIYTGHFRGQIFNHAMGLGEPIGSSMRTTINFEEHEIFEGRDPGLVGDDRTREFLRALLADPALRIFMVPPVSNLVATPSGSDVMLNWSPPSDMSEFASYQVWRSNELLGDFELIASDLNSESYTDTNAPAGPKTYMVQAVHLVSGGSGSFYSNSQGLFAEVGLKMDTLVLPPFSVGEDMNFNFNASGIAGTSNWSVVSGHLPDGVTLAADGSLSGNPVVAGEYAVEIRLTDESGSIVDRDFVLFVDAAFTEVIHMDLRKTNGLGLHDRAMPTRPLTLMGDAHLDPVAGMVFDGDGDALRLHNMGDLGYGEWDDFSYTHGKGPFAVSLSFKAEASSLGGVLISKSESIDTLWSNNQNHFTIRLQPNGEIQAWTGWQNPLKSAPGFNDGQWHNATFTYDPDVGKTRFYVDGVFIGEQGPSLRDPLADLLVGARWDGSGESAVTDSFDGLIADLRVYASEIKAGEAKAHYERLAKNRPDIHPSPPVFVGLPTQLETYAGSVTRFPLDVVDDNGEPLKLHAAFSDPATVDYHEIVKTASGYALKLQMVPDYIAGTQVTLSVEDGYPGHVYSVQLDIMDIGPIADDLTAAHSGFTDLDVLANDLFASGHSHVIDSVSDPSEGQIRIVDGKIRFFPPPLWEKPVTFSYVLREVQRGILETTSVVIRPSNKPNAVNDSFQHAGSSTVLLDVLANDSDNLGESFRLIRLTQPLSGSVKISGNQVEYMPSSVGIPYQNDFTYTIVNDSGFTSTARVSIFSSLGSMDPLVRLEMEEGSGNSLINAGSLGAVANASLSGTPNWAAGPDGLSLELTGGDDIVRLGNPAELNFNPDRDNFSVSMAVDTDFADDAVYPFTLISKGDNRAGNAQIAIVAEKDSALATIRIYIKGERISCNQVEPNNWTYPENINFLKWAPNWQNSDAGMTDWHHFSVINDADKKRLRVYVDQFLVADVDTSNMDFNQGDNGSDWIVGASPNGGGHDRFLAGKIDNVTIHARAIEGVELKGAFADLDFNLQRLMPFVRHFYPAGISTLKTGETVTFSVDLDMPDMPTESEGQIASSLGMDFIVGGPVGYWTIQYDAPTGHEDYLAYRVRGESIEVTPHRDGTLLVKYSHGFYFDYIVQDTVNLQQLFSKVYTVSSGASSPPAKLAFHSGAALGSLPIGRPSSVSVQPGEGSSFYLLDLVSGALPPGMSLNTSTGEIGGTPSAQGTYGFLLKLQDFSNPAVFKHFTLTITSADSDADDIPDGWEMSHFGGLGTDLTTDSDGDGLSSLMEYALGMNPTLSEVGVSPIEISETIGPMVAGSDRYIALKYKRRRLLGALTYKLQSSLDLHNWTDLNLSETVLADDGELQLVHIRHPQGSERRLFYRILVQKP